MPGVGRTLYAGLKVVEAKLSKNSPQLRATITEILENFSIIVMIHFAFLDLPKELTTNFTCKMSDFQCAAGVCEAGWGARDSIGGVGATLTRQLIGLLLIMAGVESNPGPSELMDGLAAIIAKAPWRFLLFLYCCIITIGRCT